MPPETGGPESPTEWLRRARSNLARAKATDIGPDVLLEDLCFDAQQACEKSLKAVLVLKGRTVPRTHSIGELIAEVMATGLVAPAEIIEAAVLTDYAVSARYPGPAEAVSEFDHVEAVRLAEAVVAWATRTIESGG
jgi:HEPN domain-containing protein